MTMAEKKLRAARNLLSQGNVLAGMGLILEVGQEYPSEIDPTLLATMPLWHEVVKHLSQLMHEEDLLGEGTRH
jgi:hypothetical protein